MSKRRLQATTKRFIKSKKHGIYILVVRRETSGVTQVYSLRVRTHHNITILYYIIQQRENQRRACVFCLFV